jgi:hypothetical protein
MTERWPEPPDDPVDPAYEPLGEAEAIDFDAIELEDDLEDDDGYGESDEDDPRNW